MADGDTAAAPTTAPTEAPSPTEQAPAAPEGQQPAEAQQPDRVAAIAARYARTERELKKAQKALQERDAKLTELSQFQESFKADPIAFLESNGFDYSKWTAHALRGKQEAQDPLEPLKTELEQLKAWKEQREQTETQTAQKREEQQLREEMRAAVESSPELAFTASLGQSDVVLAQIRQYQQEYGECPPAEQRRIALETESSVRGTVKQQLAALSKIDGFREMLQEALGDGSASSENTAGQQARTGQAPAAAPKPKPKTLTNSQAAEVGARSDGPRSATDRIRAAAKRLEQGN
jgi:hypothetical protein